MSCELDTLISPTPQEQYAYACPACVYKLAAEEELEFSMLLCMDGNESLKRMRRVRRIGEESNKKNPKFEAIERHDNRIREARYFLEASEVNEFAGEVKARAKASTASQKKVTAVSVYSISFVLSTYQIQN